MDYLDVIGQIVGLHHSKAVAIWTKHRWTVHAFEVALEIVQAFEGLCAFVLAALEGAFLHFVRRARFDCFSGIEILSLP